MSYAKGTYVHFETQYRGPEDGTYLVVRGAVKAVSYGAIPACSETQVNIDKGFAIRAATANEILDYKRRRMEWHREESRRHAILAQKIADELGEITLVPD